jgi:hypothetical protein
VICILEVAKEEERIIMGDSDPPIMSTARPLILTALMLIVILVVPSYVSFNGRLEISATTWLLRIDEDQPIRFLLTLDMVHFQNGLIRMLFIIVVFRFLTNRTTLRRAILFGTLIEVLIYLSRNFGNVLYLLFPVSGFEPQFPSEAPMPIYLLVFLVLALLKPHIISEKKETTHDWLDSGSAAK